MRCGVHLLGVLALASLGPLPARAQDPPTSGVVGSEPTPFEGTAATEGTAAPNGADQENPAREKAREIFAQGVALYRDKRFPEALRAFEKAREIYPSPAFTFNIARTCDELGEAACALRHYRAYQRQAPEAPEKDLVTGRIRALESVLRSRGIQQITVFSTPEGATLTVDGVELGKTPWTGELVPGTHRIRLASPGHSNVEVDIDVPAAHTIDRSYELPPTEPVPPAPTTAPPPERPPVTPDRSKEDLAKPSPPPPLVPILDQKGGHHPIRPWTYAAVGAGAASLTGAVVFEILRRGKEDDVRTLAVQRDRVQANDTMESYQTTARVLAGIGAGLTAVGVTLLVIDLRSADAQHASVTARFATRGPHIELQGTW